jgi:hypothetical protein
LRLSENARCSRHDPVPSCASARKTFFLSMPLR